MFCERLMKMLWMTARSPDFFPIGIARPLIERLAAIALVTLCGEKINR